MAYHPIVATISVGSQALFHYYQYEQSSCGEGMGRDGQSTGRSINPEPIMSMLLEPRSAVFTSKALYLEHLHGYESSFYESHFLTIHHRIEEVTADDFAADCGATVANLHMLSEDTRNKIQRGESLIRGTRLSLTCRDIEKVMPGKFVK
jgi:alkylated DNA repair protein alkB homolog 6